MNNATDKQMFAVNLIQRKKGESPSLFMTKQEAFLYIQKNQEIYREAYSNYSPPRRHRSPRTTNTKRNRYSIYGDDDVREILGDGFGGQGPNDVF